MGQPIIKRIIKRRIKKKGKFTFKKTIFTGRYRSFETDQIKLTLN